MPRPSQKKPARAGSTDTKTRRLTPEARRTQILDAATPMVVQLGSLPLPLEQLARLAGTSKALIYTYFPTQFDLFNAMLERELQNLALSGLDTASQVNDLEQASILCALLYFEHVARCGPLLHILMTDRYMSKHIDAAILNNCDVLLQRLIKLAKAALPLSEAEIRAAIEMMTAIPEEAGRLVFHQELDRTTARQICHSLIASSLKALRSPDRVAIPADEIA
jgi:AcrR family transcriptional regulator